MEIEKNLESDFDDFILKVVPVIGQNYFPSMRNKTFCEICSIEINVALLYKHINSKEHKDIEYYLIKKGMTYCTVCKKKTRNDEWTEHEISENHLNIEKKGYCKICKEKYNVSEGNQYSSYEKKLQNNSREPQQNTRS